MERIPALGADGVIVCGSIPVKALDEDVPTGGWWYAIHFLEGKVRDTECPRCGAPLSHAANERSKDA